MSNELNTHLKKIYTCTHASLKRIGQFYRFGGGTIAVRLIEHHRVINHVTITGLFVEIDLRNSGVRIQKAQQCHVDHDPPRCCITVHGDGILQLQGCRYVILTHIHDKNNTRYSKGFLIALQLALCSALTQQLKDWCVKLMSKTKSKLAKHSA